MKDLFGFECLKNNGTIVTLPLTLRNDDQTWMFISKDKNLNNQQEATFTVILYLIGVRENHQIFEPVTTSLGHDKAQKNF